MSLFTQYEIRAAASNIKKSMSVVLSEQATHEKTNKTFDIFLSHSFADSDSVLGIKAIIEDIGFTVYVDWIEDAQMDRGRVSKVTAQILKSRMKRCRCLLYATSLNSSKSLWMPWELGYMDGFRDKVAILPVTDYKTDNYEGREYLGLYPFIRKGPSTISNNDFLWIFKDEQYYLPFDSWLNSTEQVFKKLG